MSHVSIRMTRVNFIQFIIRVSSEDSANPEGGQEKAKMVDRSTNTATSAPHRSHAVAGWSQAAGTPHDPLPACNATGSA